MGGGSSPLRPGPGDLAGKEKLAFSAWLAPAASLVELVEVAEIEEAAFFQVVEALARTSSKPTAPPTWPRLPAARQEADYACGLANKLPPCWRSNARRPRWASPNGSGSSAERARDHARIWEIHPGPDETEPWPKPR